MMGLLTDAEVANEYITYCDFKSTEGTVNPTTNLLQVVCNEVYTITAAQVPLIVPSLNPHSPFIVPP